MVKNDKLLDNLINKPRHVSSRQKQTNIPSGTDDEVLITSARVVDTRYKVYMVVALIFVFVFWFYVLQPAYDNYQTQQEKFETVESEVESLDNEISLQEMKMSLLNDINASSGSIVNCIDLEEDCDEIPSSIYTGNLVLAKDFLNMNNLNSDTMTIDEKSILINLNEFMLKYDPLNSADKNWVVQSIVIWEEENYESLYSSLTSNLWSNVNVISNEGSITLQWWDESMDLELIKFLPISLSIEFENEEAIISFIKNVENFVVPDEEESGMTTTKQDNRLMYIIDNISYDITNYEETQVADLEMYIFYTK